MIAFDASSQGFGSGGGFGWSHTVGSNTNGLLVVGLHYANNLQFVRYDGVDFDIGERIEVSSHWSLLRLPAPNTGTHDVTIGWSGSTAANRPGFAISLTGVHQGSPVGATATNITNPTGTSLSTDIDLLYGSSWTVEVQGIEAGSETVTQNSGQTEREELAVASFTIAGATKAHTTSGTKTLAWQDGGTSAVLGHLIFEIVDADAFGGLGMMMVL